MAYRKLEIWQRARDVSISVHRLTGDRLPRFEMYEEGTQISRSSKSIRSNIVEGHGRRRYREDFIRFLTSARASCNVRIDNLETLQETGSLNEASLLQEFPDQLDRLGGNLNLLFQSVESLNLSVGGEGEKYIVREEIG
jgi:four helix bundle protein